MAANSSQSTLATVLLIILAFVLPPLTVFLKVGLRMHFWLNILLTILGWLPGTIHALWVVVASPPAGGPRR